jgi:serine/threonine protein kinase
MEHGRRDAYSQGGITSAAVGFGKNFPMVTRPSPVGIQLTSMSQGKTSLVGSLVAGRYLIEEEIGVGGISSVYLARDLQVLGRKVVFKVLLEEFQNNDDVKTKFRREAEALSRVEHPNIVLIYDRGDMEDDRPYLVLQYIKGTSLRDIIVPGGIELERAAHIIRSVAHALTAAHDAGVLHRDLKPENVMLQFFGGDDERVVVIDFGIARVKDSVIGQKTIVGSTPGTRDYMSPEQLTAGKLTPASDTYALGVIAYELVTGRKPFEPQTPFQLLEMQRAGVADPPRELRPELPVPAEDAILAALSFEPEARLQRTRDFGNDFYRSITGATGPLTGHLSMPPMPPPARTTAPGTDNPTDSNISVRSLTNTSPENTPAVEHTYERHERHVGHSARVSSVPPFPLRPGAPKILLIAVAALVLFSLAVAAVAAFLVWKRMRTVEPPPVVEHNANARPTQAAPTVAPTAAVKVPETARLSLEYSLTVQMMRDKKPYKTFDATGRDFYQNGMRFRMNVMTPKPGYLYLLNEGPTEGGHIVYKMLYPINDDAQIDGGQRVQIPGDGADDYYSFDEAEGTEKFWIIFSPQPVPEMEALKKLMNEVNQGEVKDSAQIKSVEDFFSKHPTSKTTFEEDRANKRTTVNSSDDVLVYRADLEHH